MSSAAHLNGETTIDTSAYESVLGVARKFASTSDLHEVLSLIIDAMRDILGAERASVFQYDEATNELFATRAHGLSADLRLPADRGVIGEAATSRTIINIPDAYADPRFSDSVDRMTGFRTRALLTIPLLDYEDKLVGVAQVLNRRGNEGGAFDDADEDVAQHLAAQAAVALKRASLQDAERLKNKLESDLQVARRIQQASIPGEIPVVPGYSIAAATRPAEATGGDAFDLIPLSLPSSSVAIAGVPAGGGSPGSVLVFMGDATGHGIGPALSVTQATSMLRMGSRLSESLAVLVGIINAQLVRDLPIGRFITGFFGIIDPGAHEISYIAAGQAPLLVIRADAPDAPWVLSSSALPMGIEEDINLVPPTPISMGEGDIFALLSDGYFEALNPQPKMFGIDRVVEVITAHRDEDVHTILRAIDEAVVKYAAGRPADDDQTAVLIKRHRVSE